MPPIDAVQQTAYSAQRRRDARRCLLPRENLKPTDPAVAVTWPNDAGCPSPTPPAYEALCRFHPAAGVFLLDLGCSKIMTIASVSVMMMITITTPRGVTIGSGFRMARGGAT
jgi:hypothetical protein